MTTMARRVLRIHTGTHKTATSTLQNILTKESENPECGFLYPATGRMGAWPMAHHDLLRALFEGNLGILDELQAEIDQNSNRVVVISCEDLCQSQYFFAVRRIADRFPDFDIELHTAFRPYMSFAESYYLERVKRNSTQLKPLDYCIELARNYRYSSIINFLESLGLKTFYHEYSSPDFLAEIYHALTGRELGSQHGKSHFNRAYSYEMTMILRAFYERNMGLSFDVSAILRAAWELEKMLGIADRKRPFLREAEARKVRQHLGGEHAFMKQRFGDMADRLYPEIAPYDDSMVLDPDTDFERRLIDEFFGQFAKRST